MSKRTIGVFIPYVIAAACSAIYCVGYSFYRKSPSAAFDSSAAFIFAFLCLPTLRLFLGVVLGRILGQKMAIQDSLASSAIPLLTYFGILLLTCALRILPYSPAFDVVEQMLRQCSNWLPPVVGIIVGMQQTAATKGDSHEN